jgi:hypothetical protein
VLNARRYEALILGVWAEGRARTRRPSRGADVCARGAASEATSAKFVGPILYGLLGLIETDRSARVTALAVGEALLAKSAVGHNHFWLRRYAIEAALQAGDGPKRKVTPTRSPEGWRRSRFLTPI